MRNLVIINAVQMQPRLGMALVDWPGANIFFCSPPLPAPARLVKEFASVTDLGVQEIRVDGRIMKRVQLFECRGLK